MGSTTPRRLCTLIVDERPDRVTRVSAVLAGLGHQVVARDVRAGDVAELISVARPDLALVGLAGDREHTLEVIGAIVRESLCPVILVLDERDPELVQQAALRGVFAHLNAVDIEDLPGAIDIVLCRFAEYQGLWAAFGRRSVIERAKGILMERHGVGDTAAFELLRKASRTHNRKLVDLAAAVADGHRLLSQQPAGRFARDPAPEDA
jgi:AmiR/NasT family two-component response regulator